MSFVHNSASCEATEIPKMHNVTPGHVLIKSNKAGDGGKEPPLCKSISATRHRFCVQKVSLILVLAALCVLALYRDPARSGPDPDFQGTAMENFSKISVWMGWSL